ncbi:MAG TPA: hypothetical protein VG963_11415 [Polyangiaceae bacterium]|nr:hypothetical protein [Polyangiaceae bacterium]
MTKTIRNRSTSGTSAAWLSSTLGVPPALLSWSSPWLIVGLLGHCTSASTPPPAAPVQEKPSVATASSGDEGALRAQQQTQTTLAFMHGHYDDSVRMRQAIIAGQLETFQRVAARVADDDWTPRLRSGYVPFVTSMREVAGRGKNAASLTSAASLLGQLGNTCAACHEKFGGPSSPIAPTPLQAEADATMVDHAMATDFLWEGLIRPSDSSWSMGAKALVEASTLSSDVAEVAAAGDHLRNLAYQAVVAEPPQRGALLGNILVTCSACHERLGLEPSRFAPAF